MDNTHILQVAEKIMADLGPGYTESIYQNAIHRKLARIDGTCIMEKAIPVVYDGDTLGVCRADIVLDSHVIEVKAARKMPSGVDKQVCKYVRHLFDLDGKSRTGVVINFNQETGLTETMIFPAPEKEEAPPPSPKRRKCTPVDD
jgi:GxxExxY protein